MRSKENVSKKANSQTYFLFTLIELSEKADQL